MRLRRLMLVQIDDPAYRAMIGRIERMPPSRCGRCSHASSDRRHRRATTAGSDAGPSDGMRGFDSTT